MFLPPRSPELNPVENVWQFMRDNWLSNRIFKDYNDIVAHCCAAWNKLIQPWRIMSIGLNQRAHGAAQCALVSVLGHNKPSRQSSIEEILIASLVILHHQKPSAKFDSPAQSFGCITKTAAPRDLDYANTCHPP
ncbi:DDE superfamily endonuclease domain-containing protein [Sinorhizobium fredii]|uniref:DDE superfamily endonuclease domain-containing protein n=1 Tax=Rhizobium fredii TaxID=380 RepID=A0A2L0H9Z7_RHIFR|nr:DDE superfamily endonuclease domain-containing protein [Sinorhizobium fredii]